MSDGFQYVSEIKTHNGPMTYREIRDFVGYAVDLDIDLDRADLPWAVERWICHELLPTIRKTGGYRFPADLDQIAESSTVKA